MAQATVYRRLLFALLLVLLFWSVVPAMDAPPANPQLQESTHDEFLSYALRPGESLSDVARIFRAPLDELMQLNHITDPLRLQVGQVLKIPNVFAQQITQLQAEHAQLVEAEARARRETGSLQQRVAALMEEQQRLEQEKTALASQLAATVRWRRGALVLMGLLVVALYWGLSQRKGRVALIKQVDMLTKQNEALTAAKEKYRQAAAQVELRYQKLYRAGDNTPPKSVQDGVALIERAFNEGSARLEQLLTTMQSEQYATDTAARAEERPSLVHFFRGVFIRHWPKYHEA
jgi:LysM repeat protein